MEGVPGPRASRVDFQNGCLSNPRPGGTDFITYDNDPERAKFILKVIEKMMASILDRFDPDSLPSDGTGGSADELKEFKDKCQRVVAICSGMPMAGQDTLQDAIHAVVTEPSAEIYRVFNANAAGKILQDG
ncbi:unnamed protein product [Symbiodinium necroappetens]|uniref:Uncharacterized protein n=1 Tax=Symbiodinium necroappetens TaxID=1628268 RepID=A0A812N3Y1_9DINO|nr:unnamed protein product [Symbiodinium necroappetens]